MLFENNQMVQNRRDKVDQDSFAQNAKRDLSISDFLYVYKDVQSKLGNTVTVTGRIILARKMGKSGFLKVKDQSGILQIFCSLATLEDSFDLFKKSFDIGDIIQVSGHPFRTDSGELSLHATGLRLLTKSLHPLPEKWNGLEDKETRYRKRYLDMIANPEVVEVFKERSRIIAEIRTMMNSSGALEVETPMLNPIPGGANAKPFVTHHNALGVDRYLRIAPELYLKRLIVGGLEKVYEIGKNFRNEGIDATHNPEFTSMEFYFAYENYYFLMDFIENMVKSVSKEQQVTFGEKTIDLSSWTRISFRKALSDIGGVPSTILDSKEEIYWFFKENGIKVKPDLSLGKLWEELFDEFVEEKLIDPTFITDYPTEISPLARRNETNPEITERFELFIAGREIANGFNELNDPDDQYNRFLDQVKGKESDDESMHMDSDYVEALMYGMPPTAGAGIGIDRLVMLLTNSESIKDVIAFPAMR